MFKSVYNFLFGWMFVKVDSIEPTEIEIPETKEAPPKLPSDSKLNSLKKEELESLGLQFGIDLDRRKTKKNMIEDLKNHVSG